jgi:O-antigen ligase
LGLFFAFCLVLTGSRGVWFAGAISIAGATIHNIVAGRRRRLAVIFVIVTLIAVVTAISLFPQVRKRIDRTGADDPSYIYRRNMATMAVIIIRDHPVAGIGPGEVPYAREYYELMDEMCLPVEIGYLRKKHLHNMYLHVTAEFGFVGLLLFIGIIVSVFIALARSAGSADDGLQKALIFGVIWAFVGVGVGDLLDCLLRGPPVAMEIFWLVGVATGSALRKKEK